MLTSQRFKPLLTDQKFCGQLCLLFVDKCHLVEEQGMDFHPCYKEIGRLHHCLPSSVPWVAVSATLPNDQTFDNVMVSLGFNSGNYIYNHLPIDNPHICYLPQFFHHPTSGTTFLDIAWLIPSTTTSAADITKSLVFCNTINLGTRVYRFLQRLLPQSLSSDEVILPYHSLISEEGYLHAMERFRSGTTRVVVVSDCFTWGVDVPNIRQVIVFDLPSSFSKLVQQIGQAGRDKQQAYAITYAPLWVKDINKDPKELTKHEATDLKHCEGMCQTLRTWFNPPQSSCP
jgi:superfamily II DNA helicase RecQ